MAFNSDELMKLFFKELKKFNSTNFKTLLSFDLSNEDNKYDAKLQKAFSSVVTRFFIFKEKHPEISVEDTRVVYFCLGIDMIASYFSEYPMGSLHKLEPFQDKLKSYSKLDSDIQNNLESGDNV